MCFGTKPRRDSLDVAVSAETLPALFDGSTFQLQRPASARKADSNRLSKTKTALPRPPNGESQRKSSQNVDRYQLSLREPLSPKPGEVSRLPRAGGPSTPNGQSRRVSSSDGGTNPTMKNPNSSVITPRRSVGLFAATLDTQTGPSRRPSSTNMSPNPPALPPKSPAVVSGNPNNPYRKPVLGPDCKPNTSTVSSSIPNQTGNVGSPTTTTSPPKSPQQSPGSLLRNSDIPSRKPVPVRTSGTYGSAAFNSNPTQAPNTSSLNTTTNLPARQLRLSAASAPRVTSLLDETVPTRSTHPNRAETSSPDSHPKQLAALAQASRTPVQGDHESKIKSAPSGTMKQLVTERQTASVPPRTVIGGRGSSGLWGSNPPSRTSSNMAASGSAATAPSLAKALTRRNSPSPARSQKRTASKSSSVAESVSSDVSSVSSASLDTLDKRLIQKLALKRARKQLLRSLSGRRDSNSSSSSSGVDPDIVLFALRRDAKNKAKQARRKAERLKDRRRGQQRTGLPGGRDGAKAKPQSKAENTGLSRPESSSSTDSDTQTRTASESDSLMGSFGDFLQWKKQEAVKERLRGALGMEGTPALRPATFAEFCKEKQASGGNGDDYERPKPSSSPASARAGGATVTASSKEPAPVPAKKGPKLLVPPLKPATTAKKENEASFSKDTSTAGAMQPPTTLREALEARRKAREQESARERDAAEKRAQADKDTSQPEPGGLLGALRRARLEREEAEKARKVRDSGTAGAGSIAGDARKSNPPALTEKKGPKLIVPVLAASAPKSTTSMPTPKTISAPGPRSGSAVAKWPESTYKHVYVRGPDAPGAVSLAEVAQQRRAVAHWRRDCIYVMAWQSVLTQWWSKHGTWTAREKQIIDAIRKTVEVM